MHNLWEHPFEPSVSVRVCVCVCVCLQDKVAKAQEVKDLAMASLAQAIEDEKKEQWRAEGRPMLFDAKRVSCVFIFRYVHCSQCTASYLNNNLY